MNKLNLYNRVDDENINIYGLSPKEKEIAAYKKKELEKNIPSKERVYFASTSMFKILEEAMVDESKLNTYIDGLRFQKTPYFHKFEPSTIDSSDLLEDYYNGGYTNSRVVQVYRQYSTIRLKVLKYLLMTQDKYVDGMIRGIISIPENLYWLQMLEQGKFELIYKESIDDLLQLYDVSNDPISRTTVSELRRWHESALPNVPFENTLNEVEVMEKIYKRIKK